MRLPTRLLACASFQPPSLLPDALFSQPLRPSCGPFLRLQQLILLFPSMQLLRWLLMPPIAAVFALSQQLLALIWLSRVRRRAPILPFASLPRISSGLLQPLSISFLSLWLSANLLFC